MRLMIDNRTFFIDFSTHRTHSLTFRHGAATQLTDSFPGQLWFSSRFKIRVDDEVPLFFVHRVMMPPDTFTAIAVYAFFVFFDFCGLFVYPQNRLVRRLVFRSRRRPQHESVPPNPIFRRSRVWRREFQKLFNVQSKRTKIFHLSFNPRCRFRDIHLLFSLLLVLCGRIPRPPTASRTLGGTSPGPHRSSHKSLPLSLSVCVCVRVSRAQPRVVGSPSAAERHVELYYIERLLPFFFLGGRQKGEKRSPLKLN